MDSWKHLFLAAVLYFYNSVDAQTSTLLPCPGNVQVGENPDLAIASQTNADHGKSQTVVLFDPLYTIQCCGVVVSWEMEVYAGPDGCPTNGCLMDFMVFDNVELTTLNARLKGVNADYTVVRPVSGAHTTINIPVDQQLPVKAGDVLGYNGRINGVEYFEDNATQDTCRANSYQCHQNYMTTTPNSQIPDKIVGKTYTFQEVGAVKYPNVYRNYGFRANVQKGAAPKFTNLPPNINVQSTTPVGNSVFKILAADDNSLDTLTIKLIRACPIGNYFNLTGSTKNSIDVVVTSSLQSEPYLIHTLTLEVTDGCQTTTQTLDITVVGPTAATTPANQQSKATSSTTSGGLLSTRDGQILVGLLAAALALAIATAVGICCLCYQLRSAMGSGNKTQPNGDPYYNNYPPNNQQPSYQNEPRPLSARFNKIGAQESSRNGDPTPRDIHLRATTPNQYYKDQLFWYKQSN